MKSQRFNFSKVLMMFMFVVLTSLVLVACGETNQDLIDDALNTVAITYGSGDSQDSVTKNLVLPESIGEISISWTSGNPDVITNAGVVVRPEEDTEVTLTATLSLGDIEETATVTVTVLGAEAVADPLDALEAIEFGGTLYEEGSVYIVTSNIGLPETSLGLDITWQTSNADYIDLEGNVNRPYFGEADQVVTLTATIEDEEAQYLMKVLAFTSKPVTQKLEEAYTALLLDGVSGGTASDITLPTSVGADGVTASWTSSHPEIVASDGLVTRPTLEQGDVVVTLTATLMLQGRMLEKEFEVLIFALTVNPTLYSSISEALLTAEAGDYIRLEDVTVMGQTSDTYFITDGTGVLAIYNSPQDVEDGKVYNIYGLYDVYFGSPQLNAVKDATLPTVARESDGEVSEMTPTEINDIDAFVPDTALTYNADNLFVYEYVQITARVRVQGDGNYDTFYVDPDYDGGDINSDANSPHTTNALMIYYRSNKAAFNAYDGMTITFNALLYSYRTDRTIYTIVFTGEAEDIIFTPSDQDVVDMAENTLKSMFEYEYIEAETFDLMTSTEYGATIVWETTSSLVDLVTGELSMPATGQEEVTLTATITKEDVETVFTVTFMAGELPNSTILEAIQKGTGHLVEVTGIVTSAEYQNTYFIQDETGGIAIYTSWGDLETFLTDNIGKEITIIGERAVYRGLIQLSNIYSYELVGDPAAPIVAVNVDEHGLDADSLEAFQGQLVELTGLIVIGVDTDSYDNVYIDLLDGVSGEEITMKWDSRVTLSTEAQALLDGIELADVLDIVNPLAWSSAPYLYFTDTTLITEGVLTDEAAVAATKAALTVEVDQPVLVDETLTLLDAYLGTTITWATDNAAVITDAGVITVPADMKQVLVTLTATITKDTVTDTKTFEILVGDIITIQAAIDLDDDVELKVQGVVSAAEYYRTYFIQDATGGIAVYTSDSALQAIFEDNVGKEVIVTGTRDTYNGLRQVAPETVEALTTGTLPAATNVDAVLLTSEDMLAYQGMLVELSNLLVTDVYVDGWGNISLTLSRPAEGNDVVLRWDSRGDLTTEAETAIEAVVVGDVLNVVAVMAWYNGPQLYYTSTTVLTAGTLSDANKAAAAAAELEVVDAITEAGTLVLPATGSYSSTIAWTSSNDALINISTGAVVMPAEFTEVVTLTATVTVNSEEAVVTFEVVVGVPSTVTGASDLFISEYIEGSSSNKALEIFNGTGADVDLTTYSLALYGNGSETATETYDLTGTLINGDVFVIANSSANPAILDEADVDLAWPSLPNWNGNDAVALLKDGVVIDVIGEVGVDETWVVGTGSTENHTLVRAETVTGPNAVFTTTEWVVNAVDTFDHIGSHTMVPPVTPDLFISEYIEGAPGNRKAIEIYNPTDAAIVLDGVYTLALNVNANVVWATAITLTGTIQPGEVFVVYNDDSTGDDMLAPFGDFETSSLSFNGDDAVGLFKNGELIDLFGIFGEDPGAGWEMNGTADATKDHVIVRKSSVIAPSALWNPNEWEIVGAYTDGAVTTLGSHTVE